jgi:tRNA-Thr(GGU) m(6)t(6)A37 methyltransferase TsaA
MSEQTTYQVRPIGTIRRNGETVQVQIDEAYRPALKQLEHFSHVMVFWWADRLDSEEYRTMLQSNPPYAEEYLTGVFATRAPYRPNPINMTTCKLLGSDEEMGVVQVEKIDAHEGTPVVDLKAYFPVCDRVQTAHIPDWLEGWPKWMPEEGIDLEPWEKES